MLVCSVPSLSNAPSALLFFQQSHPAVAVLVALLLPIAEGNERRTVGVAGIVGVAS